MASIPISIQVRKLFSTHCGGYSIAIQLCYSDTLSRGDICIDNSLSHSEVLAPELARIGRVSESPLILNSPTTGLPPTHIIWAKGLQLQILKTGTTYEMTTVLRDRQTSTFDNFLRINQTLQQAEGLYYFQAGNAMDGPVQNVAEGATGTACKCINI